MKHLSKKEREAYYPAIYESYRLKELKSVDELHLDSQSAYILKEAISQSYSRK